MVSVVIPTYQREEAIVRALNGVLRQTYKDIEIIVVDDNGEGSAHQTATAQAVQSLDYPQIRYIVHPRNLGGCTARNTGIKNALGEYVAFLDDDDVWSDKFIETMLPYFSNEKIGAVYCGFFSYNGSYSVTNKKGYNYEGNVYEKILGGWCPASTSLFIVKRDKIMQAGLFDDELKSFQDYDMWLRLSRICEFAYCKERLVLKYEGFDEQTSKNPGRRLAGYNGVVEKYKKTLSDDELAIFQQFIENYYFGTLYITIMYNKEHGLEYKPQVREYLSKFNSFYDRIHLYCRLYLPKRIRSLTGRIWVKIRGTEIVYKGEYPV